MPDEQAKRRESPKITAPIRQGCTRLFAPLSFGLSSYLKRNHEKEFTWLLQAAPQYWGDKRNTKRTAIRCVWWLLVATWSFSLQLLKKIARQMRTRKTTYEEFYARMKRVGTWKHPMAAYTIYLDFFIPFSLPSRAGTGNAVPDYLPGIKEADAAGVAVVLLLLQLQQSSASPLPFSRHFFFLAA